MQQENETTQMLEVTDKLEGLPLDEMATIYDWFFEVPTRIVVLEALNDAVEDGKITSEIRDIVMKYVEDAQDSCLDELATYNTKEWQDKWKEDIGGNFE